MQPQKTKFSIVSNLIFLTFVVFVISFIWINFYINSFYKSLISAIIISITFFTTYLFLLNKIRKASKFKQNTSEQLQYLKNQILYGYDSNTISILSKAFELNNIQHNTHNMFVDKSNKTDIVFILNKEIITDKDFIDIYKNQKYKSIKIFCIQSENCVYLCNSNIQIISLKEIQKQLQIKKMILDYNIILQTKSKPQIKEILNTIFCRNKSKNYFWFGLLLMFSSIFTLFPIYYIVIGSLLLILSIYARFNKKFN